MTIKEFQQKLENKLKDDTLFSSPLRFAAFDATAKMAERIFDEGKKEDGTDISSRYSTTPIYVNPEKLTVNKNIGALMGKTGEKIFKSGKKKGQPHKTKYLAGGYEELRDKTGRQTNYVDLIFSNELRTDFSNGETVAEPRKISDLEYQINLDKEINQKKRKGMDEKYGKIFSLSADERAIFLNTLRFKFREALRSSLK